MNEYVIYWLRNDGEWYASYDRVHAFNIRRARAMAHKYLAQSRPGCRHPVQYRVEVAG